MTRHAAEQDILDAAEALFAKTPFADVSLRQLIAASGVSTTAFYARFDSKADVLETIAARLFSELHSAAIHTMRDARDLAGAIEAGVDLLIAKFAPRKSLVRMILTEAGTPKRSLRHRSYALLVSFLAARLDALRTRGRIHVADSDALAWALVGALEIHVTRWAVWNEIDVDQLRASLLAAARAVLPKEP